MIQISRFLKHSRRYFANIASSSAYLFDEFGRPEDVLVYIIHFTVLIVENSILIYHQLKAMKYYAK